MKIILSGDRNFSDYEYIYSIISKYYDSELSVINGGCIGVDTLVTDVCTELKIPVKIYMAEWKRLGRSAGPIRNARMITEEFPDLIIAVHPNINSSKGYNC